MVELVPGDGALAIESKSIPVVPDLNNTALEVNPVDIGGLARAGGAVRSESWP